MSKLRQCTIRSGDVTKTVWTLKKDERTWEVIEVGSAAHDPKTIHHEWR